MRHRGRIGTAARATAVALIGVLAVGLSACVPEPSAGEARRDPIPSFADARTTQVDGDGARWTSQGVTVDVAADAVTAKVANVTVGTEIGTADSGIARETFGTPVRIESAASLGRPATVTWDASALDPALRATAVLVRWDDDTRVWRPTDEPLASDGDALTAELADSGVVTWATGAAGDGAPMPPASAPECDTANLPGWVAVFADPDRARDDAALRACAEADEADVLRVRAGNAGAVSRVLEAPEGARWSWATRDRTGGRFWSVAASLVDDDRDVLLPPSATVDVGYEAPADASIPFRAAARVDRRTATLDLLAAFSRRVSLGEVADPSIADLLTAMYACGTAGDDAPLDADAVAGIGDALTSCAASPEPAARFAATSRDSDDAAAVQGARAAAGALRQAASGVFGDLAAEASDGLVAAADQPIGAAAFTVLADRDAPALGSWTPTCTDPEADATALYAELAVQPQFVETPDDVAADSRWHDAAVAALAPLASCTPQQQSDFAMHLPSEWADPAAAEVVVDALDGLGFSLMTCDELFDAASPLAKGFHPLRGITAGTDQLACGWGSEKGKAVTDPGVRSIVQVWVSREDADAADVATRRAEAEKDEHGGLQSSAVLEKAEGYVVGAYVPTGLELEAWIPGYRIVVTTTSAKDPSQWRLREGVAAVEALVGTVTD